MWTLQDFIVSKIGLVLETWKFLGSYIRMTWMKVSSRLFLGRICSEFLKHVIADLQRIDWFLKLFSLPQDLSRSWAHWQPCMHDFGTILPISLNKCEIGRFLNVDISRYMMCLRIDTVWGVKVSTKTSLWSKTTLVLVGWYCEETKHFENKWFQPSKLFALTASVSLDKRLKRPVLTGEVYLDDDCGVKK